MTKIFNYGDYIELKSANFGWRAFLYYHIDVQRGFVLLPVGNETRYYKGIFV